RVIHPARQAIRDRPGTALAWRFSSLGGNHTRGRGAVLDQIRPANSAIWNVLRRADRPSLCLRRPPRRTWRALARLDPAWTPAADRHTGCPRRSLGHRIRTQARLALRHHDTDGSGHADLQPRQQLIPLITRVRASLPLEGSWASDTRDCSS